MIQVKNKKKADKLISKHQQLADWSLKPLGVKPEKPRMTNWGSASTARRARRSKQPINSQATNQGPTPTKKKTIVLTGVSPNRRTSGNMSSPARVRPMRMTSKLLDPQ